MGWFLNWSHLHHDQKLAPGIDPIVRFVGTPAHRAAILTLIRSISLLFLNLIKVTIAPLIFSTLVVGIAHTGDVRQVGRMGIKALIYFEVVTAIALFLGLGAVNLTRPGVGVDLPQPKSQNKAELTEQASHLAAEGKTNEAVAVLVLVSKAPEPPPKPQSLAEIIQHLSAPSIIQAMAEGNVLQIVVFSVLFALAATLVGPRAEPILKWCDLLWQLPRDGCRLEVGGELPRRAVAARSERGRRTDRGW